MSPNIDLPSMSPNLFTRPIEKLSKIAISKRYTPQTVVYKKGSEFSQKFLIYQLGGVYGMINLM